jgi:uncharacterized membrane protein
MMKKLSMTKKFSRRECSQFTLRAAAACLALLAVGAQGAQAFDRNVSFCNRTTSEVYVAIGAELEGTGDTTSRGWYKVNGCSCRSVLNARLRATEIFLLAARSGVENILQGGRAPLCVHPSGRFSYLSENASQGHCANAGGIWTTFKWYDTGTRPTYTLNLRRQGECNLMGDG